MRESFDIVIAGGAVMGSSIAWHIAKDPAFTGRILVIEKDRTYAKAASALSASSIRQQFSQPVNIRISLYGIAFLRNIAQHLSVEGEAPSIGLKEGGYLYVAEQGRMEVLRDNHIIQQQEGADIALLDAQTLKSRFPFINTDDLAGGSYGLTGEGWFDGYGLMQAFGKAARAHGVIYRQASVNGLTREGDRITAVSLSDGSTIACGHFINTAGAAGARILAEQANVALPVYAKKRCIFGFHAKDQIKNLPLLIDTSGVWVRPEGEGYICGYCPDDLDDTDRGDDFDVDWPLFEEILWPALANRIPAFENIRQTSAWAGHYDMNLLDHNAIVGRLGPLTNGYIAAGFSGHGLQQSPAVGCALAELILHGRYQTLDLTDLGYDRIPAGKPLLERNVI